MRVLQLIDSLRPGGAEKMAVNIANALVPHVDRSYLCCTRLEGTLKKNLKPEVTYFYLNKNSRFDFKAMIELKSFITENEIQIVHAHGTSFFLPALLKFFGSKFILIWHIHNGGIKYSNILNRTIISFFSLKFNGIIAVNSELKKWASKNLFCNKVIECKNFIAKTSIEDESNFEFYGDEKSFKVICVANIRPEKGHYQLIEAFEKIRVEFPCSLHLVGTIPDNFETSEIFRKYKNSNKKNVIHFYGAREDISKILNGADLGVLASDFEGLPLALLEYGFYGLPVVVTNVGHCGELVGENGVIIPPKNSAALTKALEDYIKDKDKRRKDAAFLQKKIFHNYSEQKIIPIILTFYKRFV